MSHIDRRGQSVLGVRGERCHQQELPTGERRIIRVTPGVYPAPVRSRRTTNSTRNCPTVDFPA